MTAAEERTAIPERRGEPLRWLKVSLAQGTFTKAALLAREALYLRCGWTPGTDNYAVSWAGSRTLAADTGHSQRTIRDGLAELDRTGWVQRGPCHRCRRADCQGGQGHTPTYQLAYPTRNVREWRTFHPEREGPNVRDGRRLDDDANVREYVENLRYLHQEPAGPPRGTTNKGSKNYPNPSQEPSTDVDREDQRQDLAGHKNQDRDFLGVEGDGLPTSLHQLKCEPYAASADTFGKAAAVLLANRGYSVDRDAFEFAVAELFGAGQKKPAWDSYSEHRKPGGQQ